MFGFKEFKPKTFNKNFLKTVIFQIAYEKVEFEKNKEEIIKIFNGRFPRTNTKATSGIEISFKDNQTPILQNLKQPDGLEMKSEDGQKVLNITESLLSYTVSGRAYKNYSTLKEDLDQLDTFIKLCDIKSVNRIAIRKINIIEFMDEENSPEMLNYIINSDLLGNLNFFPYPGKINHNIQLLNYQDGKDYLNIKYGLNILPKNATKIGQILIDIDLFSLESIDSMKVFDVSDKINKEIFNIFNWVISENTLNLLNG